MPVGRPRVLVLKIFLAFPLRSSYFAVKKTCLALSSRRVVFKLGNAERKQTLTVAVFFFFFFFFLRRFSLT